MKTILLLAFTILFSISNAQGYKATETEALLNVLVTDFSDNPRAGEKIIFAANKSKQNIAIVTNATGRAQLLLPKGDIYDVRYQNISKDVKYTQIEVPNKPGLFTFDLNIKFEPSTITLDNVLFDSGKSSLKAVSYNELNELVTVMKNKKNMKIEIAGHTDNVGSKENNLILSQNRAETVKAYLIKKGIQAGRVKAIGYGDTQPVEYNTTTEGKARNRRTEVRVLK